MHERDAYLAKLESLNMLDEGVRVGAISATHLIHAQIRIEFAVLMSSLGSTEALKTMADKYSLTIERVRQLVK